MKVMKQWIISNNKRKRNANQGRLLYNCDHEFARIKRRIRCLNSWQACLTWQHRVCATFSLFHIDLTFRFLHCITCCHYALMYLFFWSFGSSYLNNDCFRDCRQEIIWIIFFRDEFNGILISDSYCIRELWSNNIASGFIYVFFSA